MQSGFRLSYVFFIVAVLAFVVFGPLIGQWLWGIIVALAGLILGAFYLRRGK